MGDPLDPLVYRGRMPTFGAAPVENGPPRPLCANCYGPLPARTILACTGEAVCGQTCVNGVQNGEDTKAYLAEVRLLRTLLRGHDTEASIAAERAALRGYSFRRV